jgi:hypothetical protein
MAPVAVERINAALMGIISQPSERSRLLEMGAEVVGSSPAEFGRFMVEDVAKISQVVRDARIRVE